MPPRAPPSPSRLPFRCFLTRKPSFANTNLQEARASANGATYRSCLLVGAKSCAAAGRTSDAISLLRELPSDTNDEELQQQAINAFSDHHADKINPDQWGDYAVDGVVARAPTDSISSRSDSVSSIDGGKVVSTALSEHGSKHEHVSAVDRSGERSGEPSMEPSDERSHSRSRKCDYQENARDTGGGGGARSAIAVRSKHGFKHEHVSAAEQSGEKRSEEPYEERSRSRYRGSDQQGSEEDAVRGVRTTTTPTSSGSGEVLPLAATAAAGSHQAAAPVVSLTPGSPEGFPRRAKQTARQTMRQTHHGTSVRGSEGSRGAAWREALWAAARAGQTAATIELLAAIRREAEVDLTIAHYNKALRILAAHSQGGGGGRGVYTTNEPP